MARLCLWLSVSMPPKDKTTHYLRKQPHRHKQSRWGSDSRIATLLLYAGYMGHEHVGRFLDQGKWPPMPPKQKSDRLKAMQRRLWDTGEMEQPESKRDIDSQRNILAKRSRKYIENLCRLHTVTDAPRGARRATQLDPLLHKMHEMLLEGYVKDPSDDESPVRIYGSLEHAQAVNPEFAAVVEEADLPLPTIWRKLKHKFPLMRYVRCHTKKEREAPEARQCAFEVLGEKARSFKPFYKRMGLPVDKPSYWGVEKLKNCWFCDALTIAPGELFSTLTGIWEKGVEQPIWQHHLANMSAGAAPKMMVYLAAHQDHGVHLFFPYTGSHGGGLGERALLYFLLRAHHVPSV